MLARHGDVPSREAADALRRALSIARDAGAPAEFRAMIARMLAQCLHGKREGGDGVPDFLGLLSEPAIAGDSYVVASLHFALAMEQYQRSNFDVAIETLERLRALPGMTADHPLMPAAADLLVAAQSGRGNAAAARTAYLTIPSGAYRCLTPPARRPVDVDHSAFPSQALRWGFNGWTSVEMTVGADGVPGPPRTVLAYPPFVFNEAAEALAGRIRFHPVFVPDSGPCAVSLQRIVFQLPLPPANNRR
jgi:hypothetical protein